VIWKVNNIQQDFKGRSQEVDFGAELYIRNNSVSIDVEITPLFCSHCMNQLDGMFVIEGTRYGHVGEVFCKCGAKINCVASDNLVQWIDSSTYINNQEYGIKRHFDFKESYRLNDTSWGLLNSIGFDIYKEYSNQKINLSKLLFDLKLKLNIEHIKNHTNTKKGLGINKLPAIITDWVSLLEMIEKKEITPYNSGS